MGEDYRKVSRKPILAMCILVLLQFCTVFFTIRQMGQSQIWLEAFLICLFLLLLAADCLLARTVLKNSRVEQISRMNRIMEEQKRLESAYERDLDAWNKERADIKLFLTERLSEAQTHLSRGESFSLNEMIQRLDQARELHYCDHILSNVILSEKEKLASMDGITMEIHAALPATLPIGESELCSIWCNLLDNAIEACRKLPDPLKRNIWVGARVQGGYLYIKVENSMAASGRRLTYQTTKGNSMAHGYGLKIVKELAHKYGGEALFQQRENRHTVLVTMRVDHGEGGVSA